jgi:hypothetical protein
MGALGLSSYMAAYFGFDSLARLLREGDEARQTQLLDGLVSIWQVGSAN